MRVHEPRCDVHFRLGLCVHFLRLPMPAVLFQLAQHSQGCPGMRPAPENCRCLLLVPATHTCFMACTMRCQCQGLYSRVPRLRACLATVFFWHFVSTGREILLHGRPLLQVRGPSACCQYDVVLHYRLSFYLLQSSRGTFGMRLSNQISRPVAHIATCMVLRVWVFIMW